MIMIKKYQNPKKIHLLDWINKKIKNRKIKMSSKSKKQRESFLLILSAIRILIKLIHIKNIKIN